MEIPREKALKILRNWKESQTVVGLHFAARGGTAGSTMLARITEVSSRIIFRSDAAVHSFGLYKARFAFGEVQAMLQPSREGLAEIEGLHIWLESGHWLFICDGTKLNSEWLDSAAQKKLSGPPKLTRNTRKFTDEDNHSDYAKTETTLEPALTPALSTKR